MKLIIPDTIRTLGLQLSPFDYTAHTDNVGMEWRKWLRSFETMIRASRITDDEWKIDLLLHYAGPRMQTLFATLPECPGQQQQGPLINVERYVPHMTKYEEAVAKLNIFFVPKENITYERDILRQMKQKTDESIDMFTIRLRVQAKRCGFETKLDENVKDQIIQNCRSAALRRDMLKKGDASLEEVLRVAKVFETVAEQEKSFAIDAGRPQPQIEEVNKINVKPTPWKANQSKQSQDTRQFECNRCGYQGHAEDDERCPAKGRACNKYGGRGHFARKCRSRKRIQPSGGKVNSSAKKVAKSNETKTESTEEDNGEESVKHITVDKEEYVFNVTARDVGIEVRCKIGGIAASAIIDSGSKYNLMSQESWEDLKSKNVIVSNQRKETGKVFKSYGGHELPLLGVFTAKLELSGQHKVDFYVIKGEGKILIGRDTATKIGILKIECAVYKVDEKKIEPLGKLRMFSSTYRS